MIMMVVYLPPIDILQLERLSVQLGPRTQAVQPRHNFLWCPTGHRLTNQWVMLVNNTSAPVIHQHHYLKTHSFLKDVSEHNSVGE